MILTIKAFFSLLPKEFSLKLFKIQFLLVAIGVSDLLNIIFVWLYIRIIINPQTIESNQYLNGIYNYFNFTNNNSFIIWLALGVLLFLLFNTILGIFGNKVVIIFQGLLEVSLKSKLHNYYLNQTWLYHTKNNSAYFIKQIQIEISRLLGSVIAPAMIINQKLILVFGIIISLIIIEPIIVMSLTVIFTLFYVVIFYVVSPKLAIYGKKISEYNFNQQQILNHSFGGIKDTMLLHCQPQLNQQYYKSLHQLIQIKVKSSLIAIMPRYVLEFFSLGAAIIVPSVLILSSENLESFLPLLLVYGIAAFKLLPAFSLIYGGFSLLKSNIHSVSVLENDLNKQLIIQTTENKESINFKDSITLKKLSFTYPNSIKKSLVDINLTIKHNQSMGIVGSSGAGKSTLIDHILGLILPQNQGSMLVDGHMITQENVKTWQNNIGYVSQDVFLKDGSIAENIAFKDERKDIGEAKLQTIIELTQLSTLISELKDGINHIVGERGIKISGGQKQRIAIARALYYDANVIIMDEATNALDGLTERMIVETLKSLAHKKTMITIAHRLNTVKHCDVIIVMEEGRIIDSGSYEHLKKHNKSFQKMIDLT